MTVDDPEHLDFSKLVPIEEFGWDDPAEEKEIRELFLEAAGYLKGFEWCDGLKEGYVGDVCYPGMVCVCLFQIIPGKPDVPEWLWTITGDLPPAYLVTDGAPNPAAALDGYIGLMEEWVKAVRSGGSTADLIPVNAPPTEEYADLLDRRLKFLDQKVLPDYSDDLKRAEADQ